jgi:hypothetical protein
MGDTVIISEDEPKPKPAEVIVVEPASTPKTEKVITEKTTITETRVD